MVSLERPADADMPGDIERSAVFSRHEAPTNDASSAAAPAQQATRVGLMIGAGRAPEPLSEEEPTGVVGTLREMPLSEVVQSLAHGLKDALVEVKPRGSEAGAIVFAQGRVVHCHAATLVGEEAFFSLFGASRGTFRIRYGQAAGAPLPRNIDRDTTFLVIEGARRLDEGLLRSAGHLAPDDGAEPGRAVSSSWLTWSPRETPNAHQSTPQQDTRRAPPTQAAGDEVPSADFGALQRTGLFSGFFHEAGVTARTESGVPSEVQQFQSVNVADVNDLDGTGGASDATRRERLTAGRSSLGPT